MNTDTLQKDAQGNGILTDVSGSRIPNIGNAKLLVPPFGIYEVEGTIPEIDRVMLIDTCGMILAGSKQIQYLRCSFVALHITYGALRRRGF